jgi:hypothetical protein
MAISFIGKRFRPEEFKQYLQTVQFGTFQPSFVTLHHTAAPSLAQRPNGFTDQHLKNLLHYYRDKLGWSGAPHLFIDDREDGIIVFQRLDRRGIHAASFNNISWGVEMLGFYDVEKFDSGRGAKVRDMSMQALALMCQRLKVDADTIKFHRDDPLTTKSCPGRLVQKQDVVARVSALMQVPAPEDMDTARAWRGWTVVMPNGVSHLPVHVKDGRPIVRIRHFLDQLSSGGSYKLSTDRSTVTWTRNGVSVAIPVAEIDAAGTGWALVRDLVTAAGRSLSVQDRMITVQ